MEHLNRKYLTLVPNPSDQEMYGWYAEAIILLLNREFTDLPEIHQNDAYDAAITDVVQLDYRCAKKNYGRYAYLRTLVQHAIGTALGDFRQLSEWDYTRFCLMKKVQAIYDLPWNMNSGYLYARLTGLRMEAVYNCLSQSDPVIYVDHTNPSYESGNPAW